MFRLPFDLILYAVLALEVQGSCHRRFQAELYRGDVVELLLRDENW